jgi:hypothetical protein
VEEHRGSVCALNLALVEGIVAGSGEHGLQASLEPDRARCCVALRSAGGSASAPAGEETLAVEEL